MTLHVTTFTSTQSYVIPEGVTVMLVECWGAGGNGVAGTLSATGPGGGGGAYSAQSAQAVTAGDTWTVTVGATSGADASFVRVTGGALTACLAKGGGNASGASAGTGGASGSGTGDSKFSGGNGAVAQALGGGGGGGGAGSSGAGGSTTTSTGGTGTATGGGAGGTGPAAGAGAAGTAAGGGGSGGGTATGAAGPGARGQVQVSYQQNFARSFTLTGTGTPVVTKQIGKSIPTATATGTPSLLVGMGVSVLARLGPTDFTGSSPMKAIAGVVTTSGAPTSGATCRLLRDSDDFLCATTTTSGAGAYSFTRDSADTNTYHVEVYVGTTLHGLTDRGLVPS